MKTSKFGEWVAGFVILLTLGCGGVFLGCLAAWWNSPDFEKGWFQGGWIVRSFEIEGQLQQDYESRHQEWLFSEENLTVTVNGQPHQGTWKVRSGKQPNEIEIAPASGNREDKPLYGIYVWDKQGLRLCLSEQKRPTDFMTKAGSDWVLLVLQRTETSKLVVADELWDAGDKSKAIKAYKGLLGDRRYYVSDDLPRIYRRVIEHEAENGDPGEARDWARKARAEYTPMRLTFESAKAQGIWAETEADSAERRR